MYFFEGLIFKKTELLSKYFLLIKDVDSFTDIYTGIKKYENCRVIRHESNKVILDGLFDDFYNLNKKQLAKVREDLIKNLFDKLD